MARQLRLKNLEQCYGLSGGEAVETVAKEGDQRAFDMVHVMTNKRSCHFSFCGLKTHAIKWTMMEDEKQGSPMLNFSDRKS